MGLAAVVIPVVERKNLAAEGANCQARYSARGDWLASSAHSRFVSIKSRWNHRLQLHVAFLWCQDKALANVLIHLQTSAVLGKGASLLGSCICSPQDHPAYIRGRHTALTVYSEHTSSVKCSCTQIFCLTCDCHLPHVVIDVLPRLTEPPSVGNDLFQPSRSDI
jgi:hypothetical protein